VSTGQWLDYAPDEMLGNFDRSPFLLRHRLVDHPLLQLPRIVELSKFLKPDQIEFNSGELKASQDYHGTPKTGLSADETLRQIELTKSWMVLKNVELDPAYAELLAECLGQVAFQVEPISRGMCCFEAFIFVSSPESVTPFHIDPEHNFLLQIRGEKTIFVFGRDDRELVSDSQLEQFYKGAHRNLPFGDEMLQRGRRFTLVPGSGIHVPVQAPHWVKNGRQVSVSFSITFRTSSSVRRADVFRLNAALRNMGLQPSPPDRSALLDALKAGAARVMQKCRRQAKVG
jgi:hypothetical protein